MKWKDRRLHEHQRNPRATWVEVSFFPRLFVISFSSFYVQLNCSLLTFYYNWQMASKIQILLVISRNRHLASRAHSYGDDDDEDEPCICVCVCVQIQIVYLPSDTQIILASSQILCKFRPFITSARCREYYCYCWRLWTPDERWSRLQTETKHSVYVSSTHGVDMRAFTWCTKYNNHNNNEYT